MKKLLALFMVATLLYVPSCTQENGDNQWDWEQATPLIENAATLAAQLAFAQPAVQPHREEVCKVALLVSQILENYDNSDATFDTVRQFTLDFIRNLPPETLSDGVKPIVITAVDSVMNGAWLFVRHYYSDAIANDEAQVAVAVARAVARGITNACGVQQFSDGFELVIASE